MKPAIQDINEKLDKRFAEFEAEGKELGTVHEFIANFVGPDEVLWPTYEKLIPLGFTGEPPKGGGWIYMHVMKPLSRDVVLGLARELDDIASASGSLFELLDVGTKKGFRVLGFCDGENFLNA